ncbi:uncharacterized protein LOC128556921 [Mercenaria mercenaria]|uniref:uncharacterized protein LOC128556921 n=1 Tax=Mercenaria mercenaria TaxID=6596 RepID=UPI00234F6A93|nr:uncharacterized protein LOC128556921 [Mercenaria mercenaria]
MANRAFSSSSCSLKAATVLLLIVLILHIIGFALPKWVIVEFSVTRFSTRTESGYHAGLWQHCGCAKVHDSSVCLCFSRINDPAWFKTVQAAETLGLIGLIISMLLSLALMCYKQNKKYKIINLIIVIISGTLMLIGVIIFGVKTKEMTKAFEDIDNYSESVEFKGDYGELGYAFILCTVAGCLCIAVCVPLYKIDICTTTQETSYDAPVHYTAQNNPQGYVQGGQQPMMNVPTHPQTQYGSPPAYEHCYAQGNSGIPYKS